MKENQLKSPVYSPKLTQNGLLKIVKKNDYIDKSKFREISFWVPREKILLPWHHTVKCNPCFRYSHTYFSYEGKAVEERE